MYPTHAWHAVIEKMSALPFGAADTRGLNRFFLSGAVEVEVDKAGRILVPDFLKEFAKLNQKVVLAGIHDRVEIWDEKKWNDYKEKIEKQADDLAEKLSSIGAL